MSSAAGERREVVIFSPTQLAEGFSAFPLNGGETSACGNGELGLLGASQTKEASELGPVVSQTRAGGGSWDWGLDKGPTSSPTQSVSSNQGQWPQTAFWEAEARKTVDLYLAPQICIYEAKKKEKVVD